MTPAVEQCQGDRLSGLCGSRDSLSSEMAADGNAGHYHLFRAVDIPKIGILMTRQQGQSVRQSGTQPNWLPLMLMMV